MPNIFFFAEKQENKKNKIKSDSETETEKYKLNICLLSGMIRIDYQKKNISNEKMWHLEIKVSKTE